MKREIITLPIGEVHPYESGSHEITPSIEPLKKSIAQFGIQQPILIDTTHTIVAGNAIYKACVELGYTEVPVVVLAELTDEQIKQYRIADNKTSEFARWNEDKLKKELSFLDNPTSVQFCFDENLSAYFKPITPQKPTIPTTPQTTTENSQETAGTTDKGILQDTSTLQKQQEQKFREELQNISKGREVKPKQYIEHICSKCGREITIKI